MERLVVVMGWILVAGAALWFRFHDLGSRPIHADEATGARITAARMESGGGKFDPKHYHGPVLGDLAIPICRARGENTWEEMTKTTLRLLPAGAGVLVVFVPLFWRRIMGDTAVLLAGAFLAVSPLLVYFSRMFIHEMLLTLFGMLALAAMTLGPRPAMAGVLLGLMYATKESVAISGLAWTGAALLTAAFVPGIWNRNTLTAFAHRWWKAILTAGFIALAVAMTLYTGFFTHPAGAWDAIRTFFVYETVQGHDKPPLWYLHLMAWPKFSGGRWWFETPLLLLAAAAFVGSFIGRGTLAQNRHLIRFLAFGAMGHLVIYSVFSYKTPWLACLPWVHVCLLAGFAFSALPKGRVATRWITVAAGAMVAIWPLASQAHVAIGRLSSDERNPYAYVPTRRDMERLEDWLGQVRRKAEPGTAETAAVIGSDYWPLPWYLRGFEKVGYWPLPPNDLQTMAFVFAMPEVSESTGLLLKDTHIAVPRGLRTEVPLLVHIRKDLWDKWMEVDP